MVRYQNVFYPGNIALPLIISYLAFDRPLNSSALEKFQIDTKVTSIPAATSAPLEPVKSSFLHRWFGQEAASSNRDPSPKIIQGPPSKPPPEEPERPTRKTLRPTSDMLKLLDLELGANIISFCVESALQGTQIVEGYIYMWPQSARIVISDVDGTITRSYFALCQFSVLDSNSGYLFLDPFMGSLFLN